MHRINIFQFIIVFTSSSVYSQIGDKYANENLSENTQKEDEPIQIQLKTGILSYKNFSNRLHIGVGFTWFAIGNLGLNWNLSFGKNYIHAPLAVPGLIYLSNKNGLDTVQPGASINENKPTVFILMDVFSYLAFIIPEGISYRFEINEYFFLMPYINPAGVDFIKYDHQEKGQDTYPVWSVGLKTDVELGRGNWILSPWAEFRAMYQNSNKAVDVGFSFIYNFKTKAGPDKDGFYYN